VFQGAGSIRCFAQIKENHTHLQVGVVLFWADFADRKLLFEPEVASNTKSGKCQPFFYFCSEIDLYRLGE
jgi:hypothetical protein